MANLIRHSGGESVTDNVSDYSETTIDGSLATGSDSEVTTNSDTTVEGILDSEVDTTDPRSESTIDGELESSDSLDSLSETDSSRDSDASMRSATSSASTDNDDVGSNDILSSGNSYTDGSSNIGREHQEIGVPQNKERAVVANILASSCCEKECLSYLTAHLLTTSRAKVHSFSQTERKQWIVSKIADNSIMANGKLDVHFSIGGSEICKIAFQTIYNISPKSIYRAIKMVQDGHYLVEHGNKGTKNPTEKLLTAKSWMTRYFKLVGDKMPDKDQTHLPSWDSRKAIFNRYQDDMKEEFQEEIADHMISLSQFYKLWKRDFPSVVIPKVCVL